MNKHPLQSKTIWGAILAVVLPVAAAGWTGYRETGEWQSAIDNAFPILLSTLLPSGLATIGRYQASQPIGGTKSGGGL